MISRILKTAALACALATSAQAQMSADVKFAPGNYGANVSGTVIGNDYFDYTLGAKAGQDMFVELTVVDSNGSGTVYFNILPPGGDGTALYNSSINGNSTTVDLPRDGTYTIRVYQMGNDADTGVTSGYRIDLSIQ